MRKDKINGSTNTYGATLIAFKLDLFGIIHPLYI